VLDVIRPGQHGSQPRGGCAFVIVAIKLCGDRQGSPRHDRSSAPQSIGRPVAFWKPMIGGVMKPVMGFTAPPLSREIGRVARGVAPV
jgi:hypothetical protein